jgi:hypothetical protein
VEEPILVISEEDAPKLWGDAVVDDGPEPRERDPWRTGVSAILSLTAVVGIFIVASTPVRPPAGTAAPRQEPAAVVRLREANRAMNDRVVRLEETNNRLYAAIEAANEKLAEINVLRARFEFGLDESGRTETADATRW